jgi:hypothetical protein
MQAMMATQMNDMVRAFEISYRFLRSSSKELQPGMRVPGRCSNEEESWSNTRSST